MDEIKPTISPQDALLSKRLAELKNTQDRPEKLQQAAQDFESLFVYFMLRSMRKTVIKSGLLDSGLSGDIMESLFDQELSKKIARQSNLGIAETLVRQLSAATTKGAPGLDKTLNIRQLPKRSISARRASRQYFLEDMSRRLAPFERYIQESSRQSRVDSNLIRAVISAESSGNARAVSPSGAKGLMQLMDATAREVGVKDVFNPQDNIRGGTAYLGRLLKQFKGNTELAIAAYNAGPAAVERHQGIPPFPETRTYVRRVMDYYQKFSQK